ncbi:tRNA N(3)-methylcytidine methyltransferase METTL8, mitochondrial isoform X3 [Alexandromys fortis]|uniref:tRNA N(3)-methylcytidine methyltransferase METTL8, mitochondrial isoform X3 n=1 Tax=Alexandromys fortis TaxID=100897 RepID=UPI0021537017|nr:tRNA N(3)-methylcytidine methyltransferase METTL8, mitochondrial isoform X3 [Microtus fortis]
MNVIWRNCICRLRQGKAPHRCQSGVHPVAPLGSRILTDPAKVFEHNMWDHMQWSEEEEDAARKQVEENSATRVAPEEQVKFERDANKYWDTFYQTHKNKFFKNRNWLLREFPEILPVDQSSKEKVEGSSWDQGRSDFSNMQRTEKDCQKSRVSSAPWSEERSNFPNQDLEEHSEGPGKTERFPGSKATFRILEVGCGAGNCVFPIMNTLRNIPGSFLYCCDFASEAVELVKGVVYLKIFMSEEMVPEPISLRKGKSTACSARLDYMKSKIWSIIACKLTGKSRWRCTECGSRESSRSHCPGLRGTEVSMFTPFS